MSRSLFPIYLTLVIILGFYALGLFMPAYWNWGVFRISGFFEIQLIGLGIALMLALIPGFSSKLFDSLTVIFGKIARHGSHLPLIVRGLLWIIIPFILLYIVKYEVHVYGDAQNLIGSIVSGEVSSPFYNRIGMLMQVAAKSLNIIGGTREAAANYVAIISIISGIIFLFFAWKTFSLLVKPKGLAATGYIALITSGLVVLFAGYIETYAVIIAWLSIYIYYAILTLHGNGKVTILILIFIAGICWHFWFIAFLPSLVYVFHRRVNILTKKAVWAIGSAFIIGIYILGQAIRRGDFPLTIPILPTGNTNYWLFSPDHLLDIFNQLIMVGPALGIITLVILVSARRKNPESWYGFLAWAAIPSLLLTFMIDPHLGAARDWDLLSIFAVPLTALGALLLIFGDGVRPKAVLSAIILFNIIHTGGILAVNRNQDYAVDRIVNITYDDPHYQSEYYDGIRNRQFSVILANIYDRNEEAIRFMERRKNPDSDDVLAMANYHFNIEDYRTAAHFYGLVSNNEQLSPLHQFCYGKSKLFSRNPEAALDILKPVLRDSTFFELHFYIGAAYLLTMKADSAVKYFDSGLAVSGDPPSDLGMTLEFVRSSGVPLLIAHFQKKLLFMFPDSTSIRNELVRLYEQAGMADSAQFYRNYNP